MGLLRSFDLEWVNACGKKYCKNMFWRIRAAVKRAVKSINQKQVKFQYDPSSYALNFDDGNCLQIGDGAKKTFIDVKVQDFPEIPSSTTWVYVLLWIETK